MKYYSLLLLALVCSFARSQPMPAPAPMATPNSPAPAMASQPAGNPFARTAAQPQPSPAPSAFPTASPNAPSGLPIQVPGGAPSMAPPVETIDEDISAVRVGRVNGFHIYRGQNTYVFEPTKKRIINRHLSTPNPAMLPPTGPAGTVPPTANPSSLPSMVGKPTPHN